MHVTTKSHDMDNNCMDHETCERLTVTEPLQSSKIKNHVTKYKSRRGLLAQCLATAVVTISTVGAGMPIGYSAVLLPQLKSSNGSLQIDEEMGSWIASIHSAASPFGSFLSGLLMDYLGRKMALQISCIPLLLGWCIISTAPNHALILLGRVLAGTSVGLSAAPGQVYIAEMSEPSMRGVLSSIPFASYSFGILLIYLLGSTSHWRVVAGLSTIIPAVSIVMYFFLPESPVWLVKNGKLEEAKKAYVWLRGGDTIQAKQEIQCLIDRAEREPIQEKNSQSIWKLLLTPQVIKPFLIVNIFTLFQTLAGTYLFVFYAVEIISHMGIVNVNEFFAAVLTAGVRFVFTIVACVLLGFVGRRSIGLGSTLGTGIAALCLSMFLYSDCKNNGYAAALSLLVYVAANTVGLLVLPGVMVGELYPTKIRGLAGSLTLTLFHLTMFTVTKLFPILRNILGIHGFFFLFGISSLIASVFVYFMLPETKNKTLSEIEDYFTQSNIIWLSRHKCQKTLCNNNNTKA